MIPKHLHRRGFLKNAWLGLAAMACCSNLSGGAHARRKMPNIVWVLAYDMGWADPCETNNVASIHLEKRRPWKNSFLGKKAKTISLNHG